MRGNSKGQLLRPRRFYKFCHGFVSRSLQPLRIRVKKQWESFSLNVQLFITRERNENAQRIFWVFLLIDVGLNHRSVIISLIELQVYNTWLLRQKPSVWFTSIHHCLDGMFIGCVHEGEEIVTAFYIYIHINLCYMLIFSCFSPNTVIAEYGNQIFIRSAILYEKI